MTRKLLVFLSILFLMIINLSIQFSIDRDGSFKLKSLEMSMNAFAEDDPPYDPYDPYYPYPEPNSPYPPYDTLFTIN